MNKKQGLALGLFVVSLFLLGFIVFTAANTEIKIQFSETKTVASKIPPNFSVGTTLFLMLLTAVASSSGFYYITDFSRHLSLSKRQQISVQMLEGDTKVVYLYILEKQECLQKDLVYELGLPKAKVTRILDKLDHKNLVKRISYGKTNKIVPVE